MIIITPNPAIDRTMFIPRLVPGGIHRSTYTVVAAGGKGMNAARAARTLGADPLCMGLIGGDAGEMFSALASRDGFRGSWVSIAAETRTCVILADESGEATVINEPGPQVDMQEWLALEEKLISHNQHISRREFLCFCGSLPPGLGPEALGTTIGHLTDAGWKNIWVDTSGLALKSALEAAPAGIKVNADEAGDALGLPVDTLAHVLDAAAAIRSRGIASVVLTLGKDGAVLVDGQGSWRAVPPPIKAVNAVGSGDSFFGALVCALEKGSSSEVAIRWGVAAGAVNAASGGGARFERISFEQLLAGTVCEPV